MKISERVNIILKKHYDSINQKILLIQLIKEMILVKKKEKLSYYYCFKKHLQYLNKINLLSYIYFTFTYKINDRPIYLLPYDINYTEKDMIFVNSLFTEEYKINTEKINTDKDNYNIKLPVEYLHPILGKINVSSYKVSLEIHLEYIKKNDINLSHKWLDIAMITLDKPKYIKYEYF